MDKDNLKIQIVGTVRDVANIISQEIAIVERAFEKFGSLNIFLVESDSRDKTLKTLQKLKETKRNFEFVSLGNLQSELPIRYERIAYCREQYLNYVRENSDNIDYVVVVDLDGMNLSLSEDSVGNAFSQSDNWDAIFANQRGRYYDIGALRHRYWSPNDCFSVMHWASSITTNESARLLAIQSRMIKIDESAGLIPVESAFGGLAIYRVTVFIQSSYIGLDENSNPQLDHVAFNLRLSKRGFRLFIDSQLINCVLNSHNASESAIYDRLKNISRNLPSSPIKRRIKGVILKLLSKFN
jgi:hypothetical protein